jgi:KDO2-lipid IV(A) lauroyltransferase
MMAKKLIDILVYSILKFIGILIIIIPGIVRNFFGKLTGLAILLLFYSRFRLAKENIRMALRPDNEREVSRIARKSFENLGIVLLEVLMVPRMNRKDFVKLVKISGIDVFEKALARGKGVVLLSAHYSNWEWGALTAGIILKQSILIIVEKQTNDMITKKFEELRTRFGNRTIGRYEAARGIISELKNGGVVAILGDQSASPNKDVFVDFLGLQSLTYEAPAALSLKFDASLIFAITTRLSDGSYLLKLSEVDTTGLSDCREDIKKLTQNHAKMLEKEILANPSDWGWMHKRWKHKPIGKIHET